MIVHLFNSSSVSGPEQLVLPALATIKSPLTVINLSEERLEKTRPSSPLEEFCRSLGVHVESIKVKGRWDAAAIVDLKTTIQRLNPDVVHAHAIKASIYLSQAAQGPRQYSIVSTHHGLHGLPDWKYRVYEWFYRKRYLKSFNRTLCVSNADYRDLLKSGIGPDRLRLHLNGIDGRLVNDRQRPETARAIRAQWLPQESDPASLILLGVVGRLSPEKDHARMLNVLGALSHLDNALQWKCLVFGTGALQDDLIQETRRLGLQNKVLWMGYRHNIGSELAGLDLLLSFSNAEGLPINLVEAGWAGIPVMSTSVGGVTDLIPDESFGTRMAPEEPAVISARRLLGLLSEPGRKTLRQQARQYQERILKEFTREKWLQRLQDIYAELNVRFETQPTSNPDLSRT